MKRLIVAFVTALLLGEAAWGHRLDEYLQATRIAVGMKQIRLEMDLTPGVAILQELLPLLDSNKDGHISSQEQKQYAQRVLQDVSLALDGQQQTIKLVAVSFPSLADMEAGEGTIHLKATVNLSAMEARSHELLLRNAHLPKISVYLVNALVPESRAIQITQQIRDERQTEYRLRFLVKPPL
jgi:hypothetical protein